MKEEGEEDILIVHQVDHFTALDLELICSLLFTILLTLFLLVELGLRRRCAVHLLFIIIVVNGVIEGAVGLGAFSSTGLMDAIGMRALARRRSRSAPSFFADLLKVLAVR